MELNIKQTIKNIKFSDCSNEDHFDQPISLICLHENCINKYDL